ncbi:ribonuclease P/MRP protein subunit RPP40 [Coccidioides immitis RS]|uniref:Ribonuclease P/MRP protein subunit RPP40 n=1 Tax=Coccidioides immitis (strain RS) TaxID=246410 RepID=J3K140_COCIM|nr:ribonuclease P/MRP protein subunit RPP40 [Coccidioides immitis RS]EAS27643.3 ribonuclease P/MRP protein subunit RPP40 [Coccidioides immitis RS]
MFDIDDSALDKEKCYTTIGELPHYVDPKQPPTRKSPFSTVSRHCFVHSTELILPEEIYQAAWDSIANKISICQYAKVFMSLSDILDGEFFNKYIKTGNILMISEGQSGVDNVYSLRDGILRLELDKSSYERAGLVGKSVRSGGKKHVASRYVVEINLRLPSMLHGKKGFERIVWAFKNVLNESLTWLFSDLSPSSDLSGQDAPIKRHSPQIFSCTSTKSRFQNVLTPSFTPSTFQAESEQAISELSDTCVEIQEWLALAFLGTPRLNADDSIDPYLSRYSVPNKENCTSSNLVKLTWKGLLPSHWITQLLIATLRSTAGSDSWFAISSHALGKEAVEGKDGYMILAPPCYKADTTEDNALKSDQKQPRRKFVCWEYVGCPWSAS